MSNELSIAGLNKDFSIKGETRHVLDHIDLDIRAGEFLVIVGHSGCGKSTLLKIIAGLEHPTTGTVTLDGKPVTGPGPDRTMIFQEHRLFPWMSIRDNVEFGLRGCSDSERSQISSRLLKTVDLEEFADAYPAQLDEPFGALDAFTKMELQEELLRIHAEQGGTMAMVTHDIEEAVYLADRIVVMSSRPGKIEEIVEVQLGRPRDRGSADFAWYKKRVYDHFIKSKQKGPEYVI